MHQQGFDGVAGRNVLGFSVHRDAYRLVRIGGGVDIGVADSVGVAHDWNIGVVHDVFHKAVGPARDDKVDIIVQGQHGIDVLAALKILNPAVWNANRGSGLRNDLAQQTVGLEGFTSAL